MAIDTVVRGTRSSGGETTSFREARGGELQVALTALRALLSYCHMSSIHAPFPLKTHGDTVSKGSPASHISRYCVVCSHAELPVYKGKETCASSTGRDNELSEWQLPKQQVHMIAGKHQQWCCSPCPWTRVKTPDN